MERVRKVLLVFVFVLSTALGKDLHTKEKGNSVEQSLVINLLNDNDIFTKHERFARHVEAVTETVVTHLLQQMRHRYNLNEKHPDAVKQMMEKLKSRLKKYVYRRRSHRNKKRNTTDKHTCV